MLAEIALAFLMLSGSAANPQENNALQQARAAFDAGNYEASIATLKGISNHSVDVDVVYFWLGRSYYEQANYEQAIACFEKATQTAVTNAEYQRWLGRAYGGQADRSHSFIMARKVKKALEMAVALDPNNISARRDLMQYLVEAPWIVGGDKEKARQQVDAIAKLDSLQGMLARAAFLGTDKKSKDAELEYLRALDQHSGNPETYLEAAEFFAARKDANNLDRTIRLAEGMHVHDPHLDFYRAVVLVLQGTDTTAARLLLHSYIANVPERSDYPSHDAARRWLQVVQ